MYIYIYMYIHTYVYVDQYIELDVVIDIDVELECRISTKTQNMWLLKCCKISGSSSWALCSGGVRADLPLTTPDPTCLW